MLTELINEKSTNIIDALDDWCKEGVDSFKTDQRIEKAIQLLSAEVYSNIINPKTLPKNSMNPYIYDSLAYFDDQWALAFLFKNTDNQLYAEMIMGNNLGAVELNNSLNNKEGSDPSRTFLDLKYYNPFRALSSFAKGLAYFELLNNVQSFEELNIIGKNMYQKIKRPIEINLDIDSYSIKMYSVLLKMKEQKKKDLTYFNKETQEKKNQLNHSFRRLFSDKFNDLLTKGIDEKTSSELNELNRVYHSEVFSYRLKLMFEEICPEYSPYAKLSLFDDSFDFIVGSANKGPIPKK